MVRRILFAQGIMLLLVFGISFLREPTESGFLGIRAIEWITLLLLPPLAVLLSKVTR